MRKASMSTGAFNRIIEATKTFCPKRGARPIHNYIRIEFHAEKDEAVAVAVDGHRMSVEHAVATSNEDFVVYVRGNVKLPKDSVVDIELVDREAIFRCDGFVFGYQQPEGEFLDWQGAISQTEPQFKIGFNGDYLLSALQAAKASVGGAYKTPVVLEFRTPLDPIILRTNKHDVKLVMPVRIKEDL
jgi:DNA polymerase III sliding clamp (beta) subunit (PCNA family)